MKTINLYKREGFRATLFPDNQPHIDLAGIEPNDDVRVVWPIRSSQELLELLLLSEALWGWLEHAATQKKELVIPYLMGARSDRRMSDGGSYDLKVISTLINLCDFRGVHLFDAHSPAASVGIARSKNHTNEKLVRALKCEGAVLIVPDKGQAGKAASYFAWNSGLERAIDCEKSRELSTGAITLKVLDPAACSGRNCVIIDDLCDGGGTFLAIARQIKPKSLKLVVSHCIFSKGFGALGQHFCEILTTDSYQTGSGFPSWVKVMPLNL